MARLVARIGAPSLEDYRRAYAGCGAPWPGDDEIRQRPAALAWFDTARLVGLALYLPTLALAEVRAVRPDAAPLLVVRTVPPP